MRHSHLKVSCLRIRAERVAGRVTSPAFTVLVVALASSCADTFGVSAGQTGSNTTVGATDGGPTTGASSTVAPPTSTSSSTSPGGSTGSTGSTGGELPEGIGCPPVSDCAVDDLPTERTCRYVFVTAARFDGRMQFEVGGQDVDAPDSLPMTSDGGVDGADLRCRQSAERVSMFRQLNWVAWISDEARVAGEVLGDSPGPFFNTMGQPVTPIGPLGWKSLDEPAEVIDVNECGNPIDSGHLGVWTGTTNSGVLATPNCSAWQDNSAGGTGVFGNLGAPDAWSSVGAPGECSLSRRLYCFEVP